MLRSYYEILNLPFDATKDEIKNRYKTLVKMYHPDVNSSIAAERIFKDINRAAEILLDDQKRKNYDKLREQNKNNHKSNSSNYTFNDLFKKKKEAPPPKKGDDITITVTIDYKEALLGTQRIVNITSSVVCPKCLGHKFSNGQKCSFCNGLGEKIENKKINIRIPRGLKNNSKLRLKEEGNSGKNGGKNGDLFVIVNIEENEELKIKDGIVYHEAKVSPYMAILGGNIHVPTLWGEATIKIPPLTKTYQSFKLINVGVYNEKTNKKGDEIITVIIQTPTSITDEEYRLWEKLKELDLKKKNAKFI